MRVVLLASLLIGVCVVACLPGGKECGTSDDCSGNFVCVLDKAANQKLCAAPCAADLPCDDGFACVSVEGTPQGVCLDVRDDRAVGEVCTEDRECQSGACEVDAESCVELCTFDEGCAGDLRCVLDGLRLVCVEPTDSKDLDETCAESRECVSGLCVVAPGADDARCAAPCSGEGDCGADVCVRLELGASACLEVLADGAPCVSHELCAGGFCVEDRDGVAKCASPCDAGACAADFFCVDDDDGNQVCMPRLDDRAAGEDCEVDRECDSGLCRHFVAETDLGTLCADPCAASEPVCADGLVCWDGDDVDVCGPTP